MESAQKADKLVGIFCYLKRFKQFRMLIFPWILIAFTYYCSETDFY